MKLDGCRKKVDLRVIYPGFCNSGKLSTSIPKFFDLLGAFLLVQVFTEVVIFVSTKLSVSTGMYSGPSNLIIIQDGINIQGGTFVKY